MTNPELFTLQLFKIQAEDGKFSTGGMDVTWTKKGKTWSQLSHVVAHLNLLTNKSRLSYLNKGARVIKYELHETGSTTVQAMFVDVDADNRKKAEQEAVRRDELAQRKRREEFEKLRREFEPKSPVI